MPNATLIAFPKPPIAEFAPPDEDQQSVTSPEDLVANLVEDSEVRSQVGRDYSHYFASSPELVRHWLSILAQHGHDETSTRLRRIVSEYIFLKTEDPKIARAYHAHNGKLYNIFIDDLTFHILQEVARQDPKNAIHLDFSPRSHMGKQVRYILKSEKILWPEGIDNALFIQTRIRLLDIKYRKTSEVLVRDHDPNDSFFVPTPTNKYWTVGSLRGKSATKGPIILDVNRSIIDGHHRLIDASWNEQNSIDAYLRIKPPVVKKSRHR
jgi:hypothetical protein